MVSTTIILAAAVSFCLTSVLGFVVIPWLRKLKYGQTILDIGPVWHKSKEGTPTMGGLQFIIGVIAAMITVVLTDSFSSEKVLTGEAPLFKTRLWGGLIMALGFALIGFFDDYIKVVKKRNLGLTAKQKTFLQLLIAAGYMITLYIAGDSSMYIPFIGSVEFGIFNIVIGVFIIYGTVNAVNLTDGIDGLCSSVTVVASIGFVAISYMLNLFGMSVLAAALGGGCAGFLIWNWHPAKVFMGDTGSMFLGGMIAALAYGINCPVILVFIGIIYVIETLSDLIQFAYFRKTGGKRLFKMAPIHHHFEMSGWSEVKIVLVFSFVAAIGAFLAYLLMRVG